MDARLTNRKSQRVLLVAFVVAIGGVFYIFPPFHIVSLEQAKRTETTENFSPKDFSERFWNERLLKSLDHAVGAETLLSAVAQDRQAAKRQYSRQLGLSSIYYYFVKGEGQIVSVNPNEVVLKLSAARANSEVVLLTGKISGNAVRDGTGLIDVNDFPNSKDFNQISTELNQRIETTILPPFRQKVFVGASISFVGCAEIQDETSDLQPLKLIPIQAIIK